MQTRCVRISVVGGAWKITLSQPICPRRSVDVLEPVENDPPRLLSDLCPSSHNDNKCAV